ncbi:MAG TPA: energy transducer TonB, partial [Allosphingosinicella sp.]|nr:energy transducer TonB [Allosphingosinicella sp.]
RGIDRERFRGFANDYCRSSLANAPAVSPGELEPLCACVADRLLTDNDAGLRAQLRDADLAMRKQDEAVTECRGAPLSEVSRPGAVPPPSPGTPRPLTNLADYLSPDDYPAAAIRNEEQGRVAFTLDVGADGRVTACRIMRSRARYAPARDARGAAIAGHAQATIRWVLPPE